MSLPLSIEHDEHALTLLFHPGQRACVCPKCGATWERANDKTARVHDDDAQAYREAGIEYATCGHCGKDTPLG